MSNVYEVIVERRTVNRFLVAARTIHEAAMEVGVKLGGPSPWAESTQTEVDRVMRQPNKVEVSDAAFQSFYDALRRGETPAEPDEADPAGPAGTLDV